MQEESSGSDKVVYLRGRPLDATHSVCFILIGHPPKRESLWARLCLHVASFFLRHQIDPECPFSRFISNIFSNLYAIYNKDTASCRIRPWSIVIKIDGQVRIRLTETIPRTNGYTNQFHSHTMLSRLAYSTIQYGCSCGRSVVHSVSGAPAPSQHCRPARRSTIYQQHTTWQRNT